VTQQETELERDLWELEDHELIYQERTIPEAEYSFKHVLTQETVYQSILARRRAVFHQQVAEAMEALYQDGLDEYYEQLAYHYDKSGNVQKAVDYLLKAGEKSQRAYLNDEAIRYFQRVLERLDASPLGESRKDWRLEALKGLGEVYHGIGKVVEAEKAFEGAIALAKEMKLPPRQLVRLYHWIADALYWQSRYDEKIRYGEMGLEILGDDTECLEAALMNAEIAIGNACIGNYGEYREYTHKNMAFIKKLEYSVELRPPYVHIVEVVAGHDRDLEAAWEWSKELETRAGKHHDLRGVASAWMFRGDILRGKGDFKNALSSYQKSLDMFERIGDSKHASWCHGNIAGILFNSGSIEEAEAHARVYLRMTEQVGNPRDIASAHQLSGDIAMCQRHWEESVSHYQKNLEGRQSIGRPSDIGLAHLRLGRAYLKRGDPHRALQSFEEAGGISALSGMEEAYMALGASETFVEFCRSFKERHADAVEKLSLYQWYLEPTEVCDFPQTLVYDEFVGARRAVPLPSEWIWQDEFDGCLFTVQNGLEIHAANGRDLWEINLSAPRILREVSGDFAVQTVCVPVSEERPAIGGGLLWKSKENFLRLDKGTRGEQEISFMGCLRNKDVAIGRGRLGSVRAGLKPAPTSRVFLRMERIGGRVNALCSADGEEWFTVGHAEFPVEDPVEVGLYAIGNIDRTIYHGAYPDGTAIRFESFQLWAR